MTVDFVCQECEGSFEIELEELLEEETIECPHCEVRASKKHAEAFGGALEELLERVAELAPKFQVSLTIEPEDLPGKLKGDDDEDEDGDDEPDDDEDEDDDDDAEGEEPADDDR